MIKQAMDSFFIFFLTLKKGDADELGKGLTHMHTCLARSVHKGTKKCHAHILSHINIRTAPVLYYKMLITHYLG